MFRATPGKAAFAEKLLANMTRAEMRLWAELSKISIGPRSRPICPWRPQVVIKGWIVDFYHGHGLLAIEVDGQVHQEAEQAGRDAIKDEVLKHFGIRVLRIRNQEVFRDPVALAHRIDVMAQYTSDKYKDSCS